MRSRRRRAANKAARSGQRRRAQGAEEQAAEAAARWAVRQDCGCVAAGAGGIAGSGALGNLTTLISVGDCIFDVTNGRCYVPTQGVTGNTLTIGGWYEV